MVTAFFPCSLSDSVEVLILSLLFSRIPQLPAGGKVSCTQAKGATQQWEPYEGFRMVVLFMIGEPACLVLLPGEFITRLPRTPN